MIFIYITTNHNSHIISVLGMSSTNLEIRTAPSFLSHLFYIRSSSETTWDEERRGGEHSAKKKKTMKRRILLWITSFNFHDYKIEKNSL